MLRHDVVDQLLEQNRLATPRAALGVRRQQVDNLDAGLEEYLLLLQVIESRRILVDQTSLGRVAGSRE
jgi:hypothetical protein